jgi:hypothetical protein
MEVERRSVERDFVISRSVRTEGMVYPSSLVREGL